MNSKEEVFPKSPAQNRRVKEADDMIDRKIEANKDILSASPRVNSDPMSAWPSQMMMEEDQREQEGLSSAIHESQ